MHKQLSPLVKMDFLLKIPKIKNKNQVKCPKAGQKWLGQDKWLKAGLGRTNRPKQDVLPRAGQVAPTLQIADPQGLGLFVKCFSNPPYGES